MSLTNWNWRLAGDTQDYPWDCSAASLAWALRTIGRDYSEQDVINGLGPSRINAVSGLLDASGAGLVSWLAEIGIDAANNPEASWSDLTAAAGYQPMTTGGRAWCHWVAVRMGPNPAPSKIPDKLWLMNPAPGYDDVWQILDPADFDRLGAFSAVWFNSW
jgi:hypothetical protein